MALVRAAWLAIAAIGASSPIGASAYRHVSPADLPAAADAPEVLTQAQMMELFAARLKDAPIFDKLATVSARPAVKGEQVKTGLGETNATAGDGDMLVSSSGALTLLPAEDFASRYELDGEDGVDEHGFRRYRLKGTVKSIVVSSDDIGKVRPGGSGAANSEADPIKFMAPSGEETTLEAGDMLVMPHPGNDEISRMSQVVFAGVYAFKPASKLAIDGVDVPAEEKKKKTREPEEETPEGAAGEPAAKKAKTE